MKLLISTVVFFAMTQVSFCQSIDENDFNNELKRLVSFFQEKNQPLTGTQEKDFLKIFKIFDEKVTSIEADESLIPAKKKEVIFQRKEERTRLISQQMTAKQLEVFPSFEQEK